MRKLLTLIFTLCITFIGLNPVLAQCVNNGMGADDIQVTPTFNVQYRDLDNNVTGAGSTNGQSVTLNNLRSYEYVDIYFNLPVVNQYVSFNGAFTITNQTPNSFNTDAFLQSISAPHILFTTQAHSEGIRDGVCEFTSLNLSDTARYVVDAQTGSNRYYYQSISWSVQCYVGDDNVASNVRGLRFDYLQNFSNPGTSLNGNLYFGSYIVPQYQHYNSVYDYQLCQILEGINNQSSTDTSAITNQLVQSTQDLITNDNTNTQSIINNQNSNTEKVVEQLTDETCSQVACTNLFHPNFTSASTDYYGSGDSYITFKRRSQGSFYLMSQTPFMTLERNKTYYYNLICEPEITSLRFCSDYGCTNYFTCGSGSFTWTVANNTNFNRIDVQSPATSVLTDYRVDIYVSEKQGDFCAYGSSTEVCTGSNKLDNINNSINQTNDYLQEDYNQSTTDNFQDDLMDSAVDVDDYVPINSVFTAFQNLITSVSTGVCVPYNLPLPQTVFGPDKSISIPCIGTYLYDRFPALIAIWRTFSNYLIFTIFILNIYTDVNDILHGRDVSIISNSSYRHKTDDN